MDRRGFLQSASLAAAVGASITNVAEPVAAAETSDSAQGAAAEHRDWAHRNPKGAPVMKRFDEQRWVLDNIIQANGIDWDQSHAGVVIGSGGPSTIPEMAELRKRVRRLCDIAPAFEALATAREAKAKEAEQSGNKETAAEHYYLAAGYWASAMWTIDEVNDQIKLQNAKKLENFRKWIAFADHKIEWIEIPYRGKTLPAIVHLPPNSA